MSDLPTLVLQEAWRQCDRHLHHMLHALASLRSSLPLSPQSVSALDDEAVQDWDQFILRFTKLQDAMGARLFPALLARIAPVVKS